MKRFLLPLVLLLPSITSAATFQSGETVEVQAEENAYAAGNVVSLSSEARGDVYFIGETVQLNAVVRGDAMLAGQNIAVNRGIGEDLHAAGMTILLGETVRGDAILFGQNIVIAPTAVVIGEALFGGQKVQTEGRFESDVKVFGEEVTLGGTYDGNVEVHASHVTVNEGTRIEGNLLLSVPEGTSVTVPEGVVQGTVERKYTPVRDEVHSTFFGGVGIFSLLSTILLGSILILTLRPFALRFGSDVRTKHWTMLGTGALTLVLPPVIALLLVFLILTIPLSLFIIFLWLLALYMGKILSGLLLAQLLLPFSKETSTLRMIGIFSLMTVFLSFLKVVPLFGPVICFFIFLLSLGALVLYKKSTFKVLRKGGMI